MDVKRFATNITKMSLYIITNPFLKGLMQKKAKAESIFQINNLTLDKYAVACM